MYSHFLLMDALNSTLSLYYGTTVGSKYYYSTFYNLLNRGHSLKDRVLGPKESVITKVDHTCTSKKAVSILSSMTNIIIYI